MNRCETFEVWISAACDGELDADERQALADHLRDCSSCRRWQKACQTLGRRWDELDAEPLPERRPPERPAARPADARSGDRQQRSGPGRRIAWLAAAALLVAASLLAPRWLAPNTPPPPAGDLVDPMRLWQASSRQTESDQQALLETFEMQLRMMRLELEQMDLDETDRQQMSRRIESLLRKTRQTHSSSPEILRGNQS